jgi:flagellar biosynthetic protein FlhB
VAEESDLEKTEQPSPRRLEKAREEGQVPHSRELGTFLVLFVGVITLMIAGEWMGRRWMGVLTQGFAFERDTAFDLTRMLGILQRLYVESLISFAPLLLFLMLAAVAGPLMLGGLVFAPKTLGFRLGRLNPMNGLRRMFFSLHGAMEVVKSLLKVSVVAAMVWITFRRERDVVLSLSVLPVSDAAGSFLREMLFGALLIVSGLALIAAVDVPFQLWQYYKKLRMTKEEVKREYKEQEGDPHLKARIRSVQREMARKRMMAEVPKADVVVTNPTHFAVALKYDQKSMAAPMVVAKGRGVIAQRIRELADEAQVPRVEAPPLARALYAHVEIGETIPPTLFAAVAEILAYVFQLDRWMAQGGPKPQPPQEVPVPPELDPGEVATAEAGDGEP